MAFGKYAVDYEQRVDYPRLRRERVANVRAQMETDGVGALITWDPDNIRYISSYYVTTPMRASEMQAVFIARNGGPHLIGGGSPTETARRMPWLAGVQPSYGMPRLSARDSHDPLVEAWVTETGHELLSLFPQELIECWLPY
jgi:Xaa-Pro aminopeptidase